jgi:glycosyltransferase involved in cell wall biosynthesis
MAERLALMSQRLTVVQVLPALESGGVERGTLEVARYLVMQGHRSIVISAGGRLVAQLVAEGSEHVDWPIGSKSLLTLRLISRLRHFLADNDVDIVHARSRFPAWISFLAWKSMPVSSRPRFITTVHGRYSVSPYSRIMTRGEQVIVVSDMIRDYVLRHYPVQQSRLRLNYRGVDPAVFPYGYKPNENWLSAWYAQYPETYGKTLLTLPGRITRWKGQLDFIKFVDQLRHKHPAIHGLIVGEIKADKTGVQQELEQEITRRGLQKHISFTGHRRDVREVMAISSIVLSFSTQAEAFGRTTLEALSLGIPVIAYAHGGVAEQLAEILPAGQVAVGAVDHASQLAERWLQQPPIVPDSHPFQLETMLKTTLTVYRDALHLPRHA